MINEVVLIFSFCWNQDDIFRGRIIDVTDRTYTIEVTGSEKKFKAFLHAIDEESVMEVVRTGSSGISRGERCLRL